MRKRVVVLGSTGSIGRSTLDVADALRDEITLVGLAGHRNWRLLAEQARRFGVRHVAIADDAHVAELRAACPPGTRVLAGPAGLVELAVSCDANFVLAAIVGAAGLPATLAAVEHGIDVGLANKESLVVAGSLIVPTAQRTGARLLPVDSEHSAIFQCLQAGRREDVRKIYLTASGGPFRQWDAERMHNATLGDALNHPTWSMGPKITIDSATMMNKALEIIEAHWLFDVPAEQIGVLVHPESVVHSMVEFNDGSVIAQLGTPDMRTPIQYALTYPRRPAGVAPLLDWSTCRTLHFEPPDLERFDALRLGFASASAGGTSGAVLNAANEAAVEHFRAERIPFGRIVALARDVFERHRPAPRPTLEELLTQDAWARQEVDRCISS
ncbi:MAG: 1-deoxy-D-xylulose-5-phosphate reductoisomerase [Phycisphaerales bacterium]|nr:1-deoxy-D-xylulose-5-phosphate reductoisomerase [Phycisphaerales bacterium]